MLHFPIGFIRIFNHRFNDRSIRVVYDAHELRSQQGGDADEKLCSKGEDEQEGSERDQQSAASDLDDGPADPGGRKQENLQPEKEELRRRL